MKSIIILVIGEFSPVLTKLVFLFLNFFKSLKFSINCLTMIIPFQKPPKTIWNPSSNNKVGDSVYFILYLGKLNFLSYFVFLYHLYANFELDPEKIAESGEQFETIDEAKVGLEGVGYTCTIE